MTGRERTLAAIAGKPHDRVPVAQHNFAFAVRRAGLKMREYAYDPQKAAQALADCARDFGYDCIIIDFDTCALAESMGATIVFEGNEPARVATVPLESLSQAKHLPLPDPHKSGRLPLWLETTRILRKMVGNELAIMGRGDQGPFGLLGLLREPQAFMVDLLDEPEEVVFEALEVCVRASVPFAKAQIEAGADLTSIGDGLSGESLLSPDMYYRFSQPFEKKYKQLLGTGVLSLHICGKSDHIVEGMVDTGSEVLELDHHNDLARSIGVVNNRCCIFGNIDPSSVLFQGTPELVMEKSRQAIEAAKARQARFVLCPGCLVMGTTPEKNLQAMTDAAKRYGQY